MDLYYQQSINTRKDIFLECFEKGNELSSINYLLLNLMNQNSHLIIIFYFQDTFTQLFQQKFQVKSEILRFLKEKVNADA